MAFAIFRFGTRQASDGTGTEKPNIIFMLTFEIPNSFNVITFEIIKLM